MRKAIFFFVIAIPSLFVQAEPHCRQVGGTISTNFLNPTTTLGTASGDLRGGIGVTVLSLKQNGDGSLTFHNQHHWVTETGDTIFTNPASATAYPSGVPGLFAVIYPNGLDVIGGTGAFEDAKGNLATGFGAVDTNKGQVVLRYEGTVCFHRPE